MKKREMEKSSKRQWNRVKSGMMHGKDKVLADGLAKAFKRWRKGEIDQLMDMRWKTKSGYESTRHSDRLFDIMFAKPGEIEEAARKFKERQPARNKEAAKYTKEIKKLKNDKYAMKLFRDKWMNARGMGGNIKNRNIQGIIANDAADARIMMDFVGKKAKK